MEQFSLDKWLKDKSRKVVTRRGNPVRIICTDRKHGEDELPIVFLERCHNGEFLLACRKDGRGDTYDTPYDLFFADEEELTEFEKAVEKTIPYKIPIDMLKSTSQQLFDLARKEILKDTVEGTVKYEIGSAEIPQCDRRYQVLSDPTPIANAKLGNKVKIIICKTEQQ